MLSEGRCGSTLLMQYLRSHPEITCPLTEPLNTTCLSASGLTDGNISDSTLLNYLLAWLVSWRKVAGCKIFCQQLEFYRIPLHRLLTALNDPPVLVLYREDVLATYVSLQLALKTDVWFTEEEAAEPAAIRVDVQDFARHADQQRERWRAALSAFAGRARNRLYFLSYEELSADKEGAMEGVFSFLGLSPCETEAYSKKQNPFSLRETVENYAEIESSVSGHVFTKEWMKSCIE